MKKWTIMAAVVGTLATCASAANTWYVAKDDPNAADTNAGTVAAPFRTIQAALDNPNCVAGDTILVKPGIYDEGGWADEYGYTNRVNIAKDNITLKSTDGAAVTHIVGAKDPSGTRGVGTAAIRCMRTDHSDIIIEGFTLRDGATFVNGNTTQGDGGGILAGSETTYLVDCVVSNCVGVRGGAMCRGSAVRCRIMENYAIVKAAAGRDARFFNCLVVRNESQSGGAMVTNSKLVNSTLGDFREGLGFTESSRLDNSIVSLVWSASKGSAQDAVGNSSGNCIAYNSVVPYDRTKGGSVIFSTFENSFITDGHLFMAPLFCDYRLLPGTAAVTAGAAAQLALYDIDPRIDRWRDLNGEPIPRKGAIAAGCYQTPAPPPAAGAIALGGNIEIGGRKVCAHGCYAYPETYPTQWWIKAAPPEGTHVLRFTQEATDGFSSAWAPMTIDERLLLLPPRAVANTLLTTLTHTPGARYVDSETGDDEANDGLTSATPFKTLQRATETVTNQATVIYCAAGDYREGGALGGGVTNRVCHTRSYAIRFVGAGADRTFIRGAADTTSEDRSDDGRGDAAVRCVYATGSCMFQGFTFVDGHSSWNGTTGDSSATRGGGIYNNNSSGRTYLHLTDCVITNCSATRGGAAYSALLTRTRITDCFSPVCGVRQSRLYACLIDNNVASADSAKYGILGPDAPLWFCTAVGRTQDEYLLDASDGLTNSILVSTREIKSSLPYMKGCHVWDIKSYASNAGAQRLDPQFVDAANGDYALLASSPAVGGGAEIDDDSYRYWTPGYDGHPVLFVGMRPTAGAFQCPRPAYSVSTPAWGGFVGLEGGATNAVAFGESVTVAYTNGARRCLGLSVDGEFKEGVLSWTYSAPADASTPAPPGRITAEVFSPDWYVDATNGDDANDGFTPETAKKTLAEVMTNTCLLAGDMVHALPGTYDEGSQPLGFSPQGGTHAIHSRVEVPSGVALVSTDGPEKTIIKGSSATSDADSYDCGPGAVRCAAVSANARIEGFTLTGGRTDKVDSDRDDNNGAGVVCGSKASSLVVDCVISNNVSVRRTVVWGTCVNCRFFDNTVTANSLLRDGYIYNCVLDHNRGSYIAYDMLGIYNCTFGSDNTLLDKGVTSLIGGVPPPLYNTICLGRVYSANYGASNCAFLEGASVLPSAANRTNCLVMALADFGLDDDLRPASLSSPLVDAGSNVWLTADMATDVVGGQRVYNGTVDIGAYEFDWRSRYAQILGSNRLQITNASPEVVALENAVRLPAGASLGLTWGGPDARTAYRFTADLSGGGDLTLESNGGVATCVSGANEFRSELPVNALGFFCSGAGYADISAFTRHTFGTTFYFR